MRETGRTGSEKPTISGVWGRRGRMENGGLALLTDSQAQIASGCQDCSKRPKTQAALGLVWQGAAQSRRACLQKDWCHWCHEGCSGTCSGQALVPGRQRQGSTPNFTPSPIVSPGGKTQRQPATFWVATRRKKQKNQTEKSFNCNQRMRIGASVRARWPKPVKGNGLSLPRKNRRAVVGATAEEASQREIAGLGWYWQLAASAESALLTLSLLCPCAFCKPRQNATLRRRAVPKGVCCAFCLPSTILLPGVETLQAQPRPKRIPEYPRHCFYRRLRATRRRESVSVTIEPIACGRAFWLAVAQQPMRPADVLWADKAEPPTRRQVEHPKTKKDGANGVKFEQFEQRTLIGVPDMMCRQSGPCSGDKPGPKEEGSFLSWLGTSGGFRNASQGEMARSVSEDPSVSGDE